MKKVFMAMAIVAAMFAAAACSCGNNSQKAEACEACDSTCTEVCDSTKCCCDSTATVDTTVVAE